MVKPRLLQDDTAFTQELIALAATHGVPLNDLLTANFHLNKDELFFCFVFFNYTLSEVLLGPERVLEP